MTCKAIIADDEKELRTYLRKQLADVWPELDICGEAKNGEEAVELIEAEEPDIIFLDIKMPGLNGMEVARRIAGCCRIVFVTAYDQYAVEAFEREAVDYLLKPVSVERLEQTVQRLKVLATPSGPPQHLEAVLSQLLSKLPGHRADDYLRWIKIRHKDAVRLIPVEDVCYFKADDKYTLVITGEGESLIKKSIKELTRELDPDKFWQIHRAVIVNVAKIDKISHSITGRGMLSLKGKHEVLTVSRNYLHLFRQM